MQTLIFTGPSGVNALATAVTAAAAAADGARVLLASAGPGHPVATVAGAAPFSDPTPLAPNLDLWCLDPLAELSALWDMIRPAGAPPISGDELPIIPGSDLFLGAIRLRGLEQRYDLACVDAGPPEALLRTMATPDTFRWFVRLFLGLDRGPGRSSASVARAIIPSSLLPMLSDWTGRIQEARVQIEHLREELTAPTKVQMRYVFAPDRAGLAGARIDVSALHLFGLAVECLVAGPTLPADLRGSSLAPLIAEQEQILVEAGSVFHGRAIYTIGAMATPGSAASLAQIGADLYGEDSPLPGPPVAIPIVLSAPPEPAVALNLPGLPRDQIGLTLSGDELIVRVGPYRRQLLLPEGLRGTTAIKASRQGETLIIRPRT